MLYLICAESGAEMRRFMNEKVLHTLEYTKIIHLLTQKASSDPGRAMCRELVPFTDLKVIEAAQRETADALSMLFAKGSTSFGETGTCPYRCVLWKSGVLCPPLSF